MLNNLKEKLSFLFDHIKKTERQLNKLENDMEINNFNSQVHFDLTLINQLFSANEYIPFTRWSISPSTISHVLNDILFNTRKNIVEFGLGASTFYIAKLIKSLDLNVHFISIESDENWKFNCENLLKSYGLEKYVKIVLAPENKLPSKFSIDDNSLWYDTDVLKQSLNFDVPFDLVLVDGPWGGLCQLARYPAIPFLKSNLDENSSIFLDDTFRKDEKRISELWGEDLGWNLKHFNKYTVIFKSRDYKLESLPINQWLKN